jgi:hypothetical protein
MAESKLNKYAVNAMNVLQDKPSFTNMNQWKWQHSREVLWQAIKAEVLPEAGLPSAPSDAMGEKEWLEVMTAVRDAFDRVIDEGYMIESSNLGKHVSAAGYFKTATGEKPSTRYI